MPHRAGYFVLAYSWDHHCQRLYDQIDESLNHVRREVSELQSDAARDLESLLNYYEKWRYTNDLCRVTLSHIRARQTVIDVFGYRGYGVNRDLQAALGGLSDGAARLDASLGGLFDRKSGRVAELIYLPRESREARASRYIVGELRRKVGTKPPEGAPTVEKRSALDLQPYWDTMSATPWQVNEAIFQKMFLSAGASSLTIMKGSTGLHEGHNSHRLKWLANRSFVESARETFSALPHWTEVEIDLLKRMHWSLSKGIDSEAGAFRQRDFPDRNGVTFEFGNFQREVGQLRAVLEETGRSFHRLDEFIYNLARCHYAILAIHPFTDCNGRTSKCFLNLMLMKKGLPPVALDGEEELMALPRYGGSLEDMHSYLLSRLQKAVATYLHEREKIRSLGLAQAVVRSISFDSGFCFRQIEGRPRRVEVQFDALVIERKSPLNRYMKDQCRIVVAEPELLGDLAAYCGFCDSPFTEWRHPFVVRGGFYCRETASEKPGLRVFDMGFIADMPPQVGKGDLFSCSIVAESGRAIFNNKGLNYSCRLES
jgi:hypothetical protein